jgi:membrane protein
MRVPGKTMGWKAFFKALKTRWADDKAGDFAASVTYFGLLAIFPFLLFLVALASVVIDPTQAHQLIDQLSHVAPGPATEILGGRIRALAAGNNSGLLTIGAVGALWAAAGGVVALTRALNTVDGVEETRPFWKVRLIALGLTVFAAIFSVVSGVVMIAAVPVAHAVGAPLGTLILWLRFPVAAGLMFCLWAVLYNVLPDTHHPFRLFSFGAIVGVLVWVVASWGFSVYVSHFGKYDATYGALGGAIVLLIWMYLSSSVILLGAEMNRVLDHPEEQPARRAQREEPTVGAGEERTRRAADPLPDRAAHGHAPLHLGARPPSRDASPERPSSRRGPAPVARSNSIAAQQGWLRAAAAGLVAGLAGFLYARRA